MAEQLEDNIPTQNMPMLPEGERSTSPFDAIRHVDEHGQEYWSARELAKVLGYSRWTTFQQVLQKVETAITQSGYSITDHMHHVMRMISVGKGAQREIEDVYLTRYACYLVAQNADSSKPIVAQAQTYFVTSTRRDEIRRQQDIDELREAQAKRLELRTHANDTNKKLAEAAHDAGVPSERFGIFQDSGYKGLYGGLGAAEIKEKKAIPPKDDILDRMGRVELGANIFRITQAEDALRRKNVQGEERANMVHYEAGRDVREVLEKRGSTLPEELPAEPTIKPLLDEQRRKSKRKSIDPPGQANLFDAPSTEPEDK